MRTDAYVIRLINASLDPQGDPRKVATMLERVLTKVEDTPTGEEAVALLKQKLVKDHFIGKFGKFRQRKPFKKSEAFNI